uniref:Uncharacterized protein n=1 Tax=Anas zonorhyncha TaxID=75864 RepID=A0A8B9V3Q6_9AVES
MGRDGVRPQVLGLHIQLVDMTLLVVNGTADRDETTLGVDLEELPGSLRDVAVERVEHLAVGALIRVRGIEADDRRTQGGVFGHTDGVGRLLKERVVVIGVNDADAELHRAEVGRVTTVQCRDHIAVVGLGLAVQALLHHQLGKAGPISPRLGLQPKEVVGSDLVALHTKAARVRVVGTLQRHPGAGAGSLGDFQLDLVGGEAGRVVVEVLDLQLDHADLHGAGHHLQRDDALGALPAQQVPVNLLLGHQQPGPGADVHQVGGRVGDHPESGGLPGVYHETGVPGVLGDVGDHGAGPLLLLHRVLEVDEGPGAGPQQGGPQQRRESPHRRARPRRPPRRAPTAAGFRGPPPSCGQRPPGRAGAERSRAERGGHRRRRYPRAHAQRRPLKASEPAAPRMDRAWRGAAGAGERAGAEPS